MAGVPLPVCTKLGALLCELGEYGDAVPILARCRAQSLRPMRPSPPTVTRSPSWPWASFGLPWKQFVGRFNLDPGRVRYHYVASVLSGRLGGRGERSRHQDAMALAPDRRHSPINPAPYAGRAPRFRPAPSPQHRSTGRASWRLETLKSGI